MLKTYLVTHVHGFGVDLYKFTTEREALQCYIGSYYNIDDNLRFILDTLGINFEPECEESLDISLDNLVATYIS